MASSFLNAAGTVGRVTINERIEAGRREFGGPAASGIPDMECPDAKRQGRGVVSRRRKDTFGGLMHTARNANRRVAGAGSL